MNLEHDYIVVNEDASHVLCKPGESDLDFFSQMLKNPQVMKNQGGPWSTSQIEEFEKFLKKHWSEHGFGHYLIKIKDEPVGVVSLKFLKTKSTSSYDIGFMVHPSYQRQGIALNSAKSLIIYAFNKLKLNHVSALTLEGQKAGTAVLKKLGFKPGTTSKLNYAGQDFDVQTWVLNSIEFE